MCGRYIGERLDRWSTGLAFAVGSEIVVDTCCRQCDEPLGPKICDMEESLWQERGVSCNSLDCDASSVGDDVELSSPGEEEAMSRPCPLSGPRKEYNADRCRSPSLALLADVVKAVS